MAPDSMCKLKKYKHALEESGEVSRKKRRRVLVHEGLSIGPTLHPVPGGRREGGGNAPSREGLGAGDPQNISESEGLESGSPPDAYGGPQPR